LKVIKSAVLTSSLFRMAAFDFYSASPQLVNINLVAADVRRLHLKSMK